MVLLLAAHFFMVCFWWLTFYGLLFQSLPNLSILRIYSIIEHPIFPVNLFLLLSSFVFKAFLCFLCLSFFVFRLPFSVFYLSSSVFLPVFSCFFVYLPLFFRLSFLFLLIFFCFYIYPPLFLLIFPASF